MRFLLKFSLLFLLYLSPLYAQTPEEEPSKETQERPADEKEQEKAVTENLKGDLGDEPFKIVVDGDVGLSYVFAESPDTFIIQYKIHLEGPVRNKIDVTKGKGEVKTSVKGFLAKWPTGECVLNIQVGEFPFEIIFNKIEDEKARLDIRIQGEFLERWESQCVFKDAPGSKFNTIGNPEKMFIRALNRTQPSFTDLTLPLDRLHKDKTTLQFKIEKFLIADPPLGSIEMEGKGTVAVIPERL